MMLAPQLEVPLERKAETEKLRQRALPRAAEMQPVAEAEAETPPMVAEEKRMEVVHHNSETAHRWAPEPAVRTQMARVALVMAANWVAKIPTLTELTARTWSEPTGATLPSSLRRATEFPRAMSFPARAQVQVRVQAPSVPVQGQRWRPPEGHERVRSRE